MSSAAKKPRPAPKRDHLLATAFRLFYRHGYHAVGIDTILAEAKLAKMTLYHHFKSKEALIVAGLEMRGEQIRAARAAALAKAGSSPRKKLLALFDAYAAWFAAPDFNGCAFIRAVAEFPDAKSPVHRAVVREKEQLIATLKDLLTELEVTAPAALARQVFLLVEGAIISAHTFGDPAAATQARDAALALVAAGTRS